MRHKWVIGAVVGGLVVAVIIASPVLRRHLDELQHDRELARGKDLAAVYCASCHLEPDPGVLPKKSWETALVYMGYMLGFDDIDFLADHPEFARENVASKKDYLIKEGMVPDAPLLSEDDWAALRNYYVESASVEPLPQENKPALNWGLPQFDLVESDYRVEAAVTTLVRVREETGEVYVGDSLANSLATVDGSGQVTGGPWEFGPAISPVDIAFTDDAAYVASIGDLFALGTSQDRPATVSLLKMNDNRIDPASVSVLISDLFRMADMDMADLNGDGVLDFVVCGFGTRQGNLAWYESQPDGSYQEHVLLDLPGAVKARLHDFNGDGNLDIAALISDAREGFHILVNDGANAFEPTTVFEAPSSYGHITFELADFDGDGRLDIMTINGDNVDSDPYNTLKNFHGVRIYLNRGDLRFEQAYFYPMYGAFGGAVADFDNDGDPDVAAISFFPDFSVEQRESFVLLLNDGDMTFNAHSSTALNAGRWMTMTAGDFDGDDDVDIVLGGAVVPTGMFAFMDVFEALAQSAPSILLLRNATN